MIHEDHAAMREAHNAPFHQYRRNGLAVISDKRQAVLLCRAQNERIGGSEESAAAPLGGGIEGRL